MNARTVGAAVLAAGSSRRFGSPKQLAVVSGRPLLEHAVQTACSMPELDPVVVILGARAREIEMAADLGRARAVICEAWSEGIAASVRCAVDELSDCDALLILLGDQPAISEAAARAVLGAIDPATAARAVYNGVPGHPVAVCSELFSSLSNLAGDTGARDLLETVGAVEVECSELADPIDIDTESDLARLDKRI